MKTNQIPLSLTLLALFTISPSVRGADRISNAGFIVKEPISLESLSDTLRDQALAVTTVLADPRVMEKLAEIRQSLQSRGAPTVVVTGFLAEPSWRGRYREVTIRLGTQPGFGDKVSPLGEISVRTFTDPTFETAVQFVPFRTGLKP